MAQKSLDARCLSQFSGNNSTGKFLCANRHTLLFLQFIITLLLNIKVSTQRRKKIHCETMFIGVIS